MKRSFTFTGLTENLAYFIGSFIGDGHVDKRQFEYCQVSIDEDYLQIIRLYLQEFLGKLPTVKKIIDPKKYKKATYIFRFGSYDFCQWLLTITDNKRKVPDIILHKKCPETKAFCEGFLDAEGWMSKSKSVVNPTTQTHAFRAGVCNNDLDVLDEVKNLLQLQGVIISGSGSKPTKNGINYTYDLNLKSLVNGGITYRINRKANNLREYARTVGERTHNKGRSRDDYHSLAIVGDKVSGNGNGMFNKTPWNKASSTTENSKVHKSGS